MIAIALMFIPTVKVCGKAEMNSSREGVFDHPGVAHHREGEAFDMKSCSSAQPQKEKAGA